MIEEINEMTLEEIVEAVLKKQYVSKKHTFEEINETRKKIKKIIAEEQATKLLKFLEDSDVLRSKDKEYLDLFKDKLIAGIIDGTIFRDSTV
jgi:hypothetical protein